MNGPRPSYFDLEPAAVVKAFNRYRAQQGLPVIRHEVHLNGPLNAWLNALSVGKLQQLPPGILDARGTRYADLEYVLMNAESVAALMSSLEDSPTGFRLLNGRHYSGLGIGLLPFKNEPGADFALFMVKDFVKTEVTTGRTLILEAMNRERQTSGLPPLHLLDPLTATIQTTTDSIMAGHIQWENGVRSVLKTVADKALVSGAFSGGGFVLEALDQIDLSQAGQPLLDPRMKFVGIGLGSGPLPGSGAQRHVIIFVFGEGSPSRP